MLILCNYREVNTDLIALQTNRKQKHCVCLTQQRSAHVAQCFAAVDVGAVLLRQLQGNERGGVQNYNKQQEVVSASSPAVMSVPL